MARGRVTNNIDAREYCETLLRHFADRLSEWEDRFVRSVQEQVAQGRSLSERQADVLDRLMESIAQGFGR